MTVFTTRDIKYAYLSADLKRPIAILFLAAYLLSTTEVHQLLKLPVVFQHYTEHKKADHSISFLAFLSMHYIQEDPGDGDYERDMKLPFKTCHSCMTANITASVPAQVQLSIEKPARVIRKNRIIPRNQFIHSSYLSNIWQPPRQS